MYPTYLHPEKYENMYHTNDRQICVDTYRRFHIMIGYL